jgi:hypothetical protein
MLRHHGIQYLAWSEGVDFPGRVQRLEQHLVLVFIPDAVEESFYLLAPLMPGCSRCVE